ncbi:MAG: hypothetical protein VST67_15220, partial [Nitrospirota bacterium]|nr:hypothetical protein [Nitrospirota bacterium]
MQDGFHRKLGHNEHLGVSLYCSVSSVLDGQRPRGHLLYFTYLQIIKIGYRIRFCPKSDFATTFECVICNIEMLFAVEKALDVIPDHFDGNRMP